MRAFLTPLAWDSGQLGIPCARLDWEPALPADARELTAETARALGRAQATALVAAKLPAGLCDLAALAAALPDWRARALGVEVLYRRPAMAATAPDAGDVAFLAGTADPAPFLPLACDMGYSRYHLDPEIGHARAVSLWEASIADHCRGFAHEVAVVSLAGRQAGLATLHLDADSVRLHIVGVLAWARGQGAGRLLLEAVIARHGGGRELLVEAHEGNRAAAALYRAVGCAPAERREVLHFWNTGS